MTPLVAVLAGLCTYRLTLLVTADEITERPRAWLIRAIEGRRKRRKKPKAVYLLSCPWCASFWVSLPVVASALEWGHDYWWLLAAGSLSASAVTGFLASYASPGD